MKVYTDLDLRQNQFKNAIVHRSVSAPSNPNVGQIYYNTFDNRMYICTSASPVVWQLVGSADSDSYTHEQSVPQLTWTVAHGLGKYPSVTVVDSGGTAVVGDIEYIDINTVRLTFNGAFSGKAYFN